jgi:hypothetical protein
MGWWLVGLASVVGATVSAQTLGEQAAAMATQSALAGNSSSGATAALQKVRGAQLSHSADTKGWGQGAEGWGRGGGESARSGSGWARAADGKGGNATANGWLTAGANGPAGGWMRATDRTR